MADISPQLLPVVMNVITSFAATVWMADAVTSMPSLALVLVLVI